MYLIGYSLGELARAHSFASMRNRTTDAWRTSVCSFSQVFEQLILKAARTKVITMVLSIKDIFSTAVIA